MANKVSAGDLRRAERFRSGQSARGPWELISTHDDRGKMEITIFPTNVPTGVVENGQYKILEISSITHGYKKDKNGQWRVSISCEAKIEAIKSDIGGIDIDVDTPWDKEWDALDMSDEDSLPY